MDSIIILNYLEFVVTKYFDSVLFDLEITISIQNRLILAV